MKDESIRHFYHPYDDDMLEGEGRDICQRSIEAPKRRQPSNGGLKVASEIRNGGSSNLHEWCNDLNRLSQPPLCELKWGCSIG